MRKLAHVEQISWLKPIENADKIELAGVLGWQCIVKKDEFKVGDLCVYIEIDSIVDKDNPDFLFLEKRNWRIKTMKMRGVISQGIIFPMSILPSECDYHIGEDVTSILKITKVEDETPKQRVQDPMRKIKQKHGRLFRNPLFKRLMRHKWFRTMIAHLLKPRELQVTFPEWITKTDETRLQSIPEVLQEFKNTSMVVTEKIDGTSTSFGLKKRGGRFDFAVCSRNVRQENISQKTYYEDNVYHIIAVKYDIRNVLEQLMKEYGASTVVLQGETIGEGIQKNKYSITGYDFYAFNLTIDGKKIDSVIAAYMVRKYGIKWVPIIDTDFKLFSQVDEMIEFADGKSCIADTLREGLVIRDHNNTVSFKCISNQFLLKHNI